MGFVRGHKSGTEDSDSFEARWEHPVKSQIVRSHDSSHRTLEASTTAPYFSLSPTLRAPTDTTLLQQTTTESRRASPTMDVEMSSGDAGEAGQAQSQQSTSPTPPQAPPSASNATSNQAGQLSFRRYGIGLPPYRKERRKSPNLLILPAAKRQRASRACEVSLNVPAGARKWVLALSCRGTSLNDCLQSSRWLIKVPHDRHAMHARYEIHPTNPSIHKPSWTVVACHP